MGGGPEDQFLDGSVLGASFWRWWNRAWEGGEPYGASTHPSEEWYRHPSAPERAWDDHRQVEAVAPKPDPASTTPPAVLSSREVAHITATMPRSRPQSRRPAPARSNPIEIPTRKPVSTMPVFKSVAEDKQYWYR